MPFYQRRVEAMMVFPALGNVKGKRILDIGCGDGIFDLEMARKKAFVEALDMSNSALGRAQWRTRQMSLWKNINYIRGDATRLPYNNATFDIVLSNCVLEHIPGDTEVLQEISRVLKPGGKMVITVPREFANWDRIPCRLAKALLAIPWLKRHIGSEAMRKATSFRQYVDLVIAPYDQVRIGYSEAEIQNIIEMAGLRLEAIKGYFKMFGTWGIDILESLSLFEVKKEGDFGYTAQHELLHGLAFPVFYALHYMDILLPRHAPSMGIAVTAIKP